MTYFQILLTFVVPPIIVLGLLIWRSTSKKAWVLLFVLVFVAVTYTTPWDNYLVATEVWWYDPSLVTGVTIGWVPVEEYTFFVVQTLMTGIFYLFLRKHVKNKIDAHSHPVNRSRRLAFIFVLVIWIGSIIVLISGWEPGNYLALILVWALIPIAIQLAFGADLLLRNWKLVFTAILIPTSYLAFVDWLAIGYGTWTISPEKTTGLHIAGQLPVEEVLFFLVTNILIVFGLHLGLHPASPKRIPGNLQMVRELLKS